MDDDEIWLFFAFIAGCMGSGGWAAFLIFVWWMCQ